MTVTAGGEQKPKPKSGRKPLQPINSPATPIKSSTTKPKSKPEWTNQNQNQTPIQVPLIEDFNKENHNHHPVIKMESLDASLAEELSAIRKKNERLRLDKEKTDKMLNEREKVMDLQMKELQNRGEIQKMLEIEVDRLYRLNELKSYCMRVSSIRSLREKQQEKKSGKPENSQKLNDVDEEEESMGENILQTSPCSSSATSSEIVVVEKDITEEEEKKKEN